MAFAPEEPPPPPPPPSPTPDDEEEEEEEEEERVGGRPSHARAEGTSPLTVARTLLVLLGGVSPAAGQNNVFANRAALLVARDAWCADPTAAAAIYGPINLWDISQVTDLSYVFCARSDSSWRTWRSRGCNPACSSFNSDISGWDTSNVTTLEVRAASPPLHPSPLTRTRCASLLLTIRFAECRIPSWARGPSTNPLRRGTSRLGHDLL